MSKYTKTSLYLTGILFIINILRIISRNLNFQASESIPELTEMYIFLFISILNFVFSLYVQFKDTEKWRWVSLVIAFLFVVYFAFGVILANIFEGSLVNGF